MCGIKIRDQPRRFVYSLLITAYQFIIILSIPSSSVLSSGAETSRLSLCFSCASTAYLSLWNQLMHHYFPPKNFTDRCWEPDSEIGTVPCSGSCFIVVEEIYEHFSTHAVMRGCMNRFLLFGLDEDVRDALTDKSECRTTDRHLLHLVALSPQTDLVIMCSCTGSLCNYANMDYVLSIALSSACSASLLVKLPVTNVIPRQPTTISQESKDEVKKDKEKNNGRKKNEEKIAGGKVKEEKDEEKKDSRKKDKEKNEERKKTGLEKAKIKENGKIGKENEKDNEGERKIETKMVEDNKKEDWEQEALNPIVTPVSDEDEFPMEFQKREKGLTQVTARSTEDEKKEKKVEKTQISDR